VSALREALLVNLPAAEPGEAEAWRGLDSIMTPDARGALIADDPDEEEDDEEEDDEEDEDEDELDDEDEEEEETWQV
jgi:hypothetical protein